MNTDAIAGYRWSSAELTHSHGYLLPALLRELSALHVNESGRGGECLNWVAVTAV